MFEKLNNSNRAKRVIVPVLSALALSAFAGEATASSQQVKKGVGIEAATGNPTKFLELTKKALEKSSKNPQIVNIIIDIPLPKPLPKNYNDPRWKAFAAHFYLSPYAKYVGQNRPDGPLQESWSIEYPRYMGVINGEEWIEYSNPLSAIDRSPMNVSVNNPSYGQWMKVSDLPPGTRLYKQLGDDALKNGPPLIPGKVTMDKNAGVERLSTKTLHEGYVAMGQYAPAGYLEQAYTAPVKMTLAQYIHSK